MEELHPDSDYYYDFSSDPSLPNGISIDLNTGIISGTPLEPADETIYSITLRKSLVYL